MPAIATHFSDHWHHTPWGKIVAGLLLAIGLSFGLQQLCTAGLLAGGDAGGELWGTLWGLVLLQVFQGLALLTGGAVSGAGQRRGLLYGTLVGLLSGVAFLVMHRQPGERQPDFVLFAQFAQPVLHLILGMLGGLLGTVIWKPSPTVPLATGAQAAAQPQSSLTERLFTGPIHPGRVFTGVFVVVAGVVWSNAILEYALRASNGNLAISSQLQARLIGWEIAGLTTLLGAGLAGATTLNGLKQGLCVGIGAAVVIVGIQVGNSKLVLESMILLLAAVFTLSLAGGWFGGQLFPALIAAGRRRSSLSSLG